MAAEALREPYVPLPTALIYCTSCRADVASDAQGRCPVDGVLGIYPEAEPRPEIVTETLLKALEGGRMDRSSLRGVKRQPKNPRQLRGAAR